LNQSNFSFPTHPSSMYLFCQSINQLTINQITLSQLTHKSKSIHKSTN
jgi:AAA15 family ATPase/GTPase